MATIWEAIREFLAKLFAGGNDTQRRLKALSAMETKFVAVKRDNEDSFLGLKDEIKTIEARACQKKRELDQSQGDSKRLVVSEIERLFRELDRLRGRENVIAANLDRIGVAMSKVAEAKVALKAGDFQDKFDDLAFELQDLFGELKQMDRAVADLSRETYEAPVAGKVNVEERMADVEAKPAAAVKLSPETEKRLKQLEME